MAPLKNDRFLRALLRQPVDKTPVWIMRQAGRYLPEYRATREKAGSFMQLCTTPELACEVTLQPLKRFPLDAAILFSDILTVPDAMGLGLYFADGEGPRFKNPVRSVADVKRLAVPDPDDKLRYVMDAVRLVRRELNGQVPLIGFAGSPWLSRSLDGGTTWHWWNQKTWAPWRNTCYEMAFDPDTPGKIWGAFSDVHDIPNDNIISEHHGHQRPGGVCVSRDFGASWKPETQGIPPKPVTSIVLDPRSAKGARTLYAGVFDC